MLKQVAAVGNDLFGENTVFVIVNDGFKERNPPTGRREQPVENLLRKKRNVKWKMKNEKWKMKHEKWKIKMKMKKLWWKKK